LADFWGYALHLAQVQLANLAAVGVAEGSITFLRLRAKESVGEDGFKLTDAELCPFDATEEGGDGGLGKGLVDRLLHGGEGLLVLDGNGGLLKHRVTSLRGQGPVTLHLVGKTKAVPFQISTFFEFLERETGIEPATNSLEGCDSTTELLPPVNSVQRSAFSAQKLRR
jgi:hypothetical protein